MWLDRRQHRDLLRVVAPPLLALGLVALVTRPAPLEASGDWPVAATSYSGDLASLQSLAVTGARGGETVSVTVPDVAFTARVAVVDGRLRTPVLVNAAEPPGEARLVGASEPCAVRAEPGVVAWLSCSVTSGGRLAVVVTLDDGRVVRHAVG